MKCPNCGFVSYPGLAQCKKCGASFTRAPRPPSGATKTTPFAQPGPGLQLEEKAPGPPPANVDPAPRRATEEPPQDKRRRTMPARTELEFVRDLREPLAERASPPWRKNPRPGGESFPIESRAFASVAPVYETNLRRKSPSTLNSNREKRASLRRRAWKTSWNSRRTFFPLTQK